MKDYKELAQLKLVPLKYEDIVSELREETAYPPYADMLMKRAAEAVEQLVKERDNARRTLDQTLVRLNDETVRADRLEAENRAKEQYIAETIGKVIKERDAAVADLKINWLCAVCKKRVVTREWMRCDSKDLYEAPCEAPTCLNFEWRGVQEVEHETD